MNYFTVRHRDLELSAAQAADRACKLSTFMDDYNRGRLDTAQVEAFVRENLLTDYQRHVIARYNIVLGDVLEGHYSNGSVEAVRQMFRSWNAQLGEQIFAIKV